ncbi:ABC transporter permease [bacterium]|nr:ABC transporter permease [bacterium]
MSAQGIGIRPVVVPAVALVVLLGVWQAAHRIFHFNSIVLPAPTEIVAAFVKNAGSILTETGLTMFESVMGFIIGCGAAYLLAIAFVHSRTVQQAVYPYAVALKSTPLIAIAPLLVLWFGNGIASKIVMSALVAFFPVLVNSVSGLTAVDAEALDLMKSYSATRRQVLLKIRIPNSLSYLFPALKIASSLAVVGAVIGEFTGSTRGIGHLINTSSYYLDTALVFSAIGSISLGGILFFGFVAWFEKRIVFWQKA